MVHEGTSQSIDATNPTGGLHIEFTVTSDTTHRVGITDITTGNAVLFAEAVSRVNPGH